MLSIVSLYDSGLSVELMAHVVSSKHAFSHLSLLEVMVNRISVRAETVGPFRREPKLGLCCLGCAANPRPVASEYVCDWLSDATGLDFGDRSWICNTPLVTYSDLHFIAVVTAL